MSSAVTQPEKNVLRPKSARCQPAHSHRQPTVAALTPGLLDTAQAALDLGMSPESRGGGN